MEVGVEAQAVVTDNDYPSNQTMMGMQARKLRSYLSKPHQGTGSGIVMCTSRPMSTWQWTRGR